jgi:hypothetical protein
VSGSSGGLSISFSKTATSGFPGGIPTSRLVAAAESMLAQLESDLTAAGIEVVPYADLAARPSFQKFATKLVTEPQVIEEDLDLGKGKAGKNLLVLFNPRNQPFLKDCRLEQPSTMTSKVRLGYEKDMEGITLASVKVTLDFAKPLAGGGFLSGAKADLQYGQFLSPGPNDNGIQFMNKGGFGSYWLKQAIVPAQNPFREGGKGEVKRSGEYDLWSGRTTTTVTQATTIDADHELWGANAENHLKALADLYVAALKSSN